MGSRIASGRSAFVSIGMENAAEFREASGVRSLLPLFECAGVLAQIESSPRKVIRSRSRLPALQALRAIRKDLS